MLLTPGDECPRLAALTLIPGVDLAGLVGKPFAEAWAQGEEGFYLHRLELDVTIVPVYNTIANLNQFFQSINNQNILARAGLNKQRVHVNEDGTFEQLDWNPLLTNDDGPTTVSAGDYLDGPWMRLWTHHFVSRRTVTAHHEPQGCCSNVSGSISGGNLVNSLAAGTGNIDTSVSGTISTECQPCEMDESFSVVPGVGFGPFFNLAAQEAAPWRLRVSVPFKRRLHFEESDSLILFLGWEDVTGASGLQKDQPAMQITGTGRALVSR